MKNTIIGPFGFVCALGAWQTVGFAQSGAAPQIAFDIPKTDVDTLLKNAPPAVDQQLRVVEMNVEV